MSKLIVVVLAILAAVIATADAQAVAVARLYGTPLYGPGVSGIVKFTQATPSSNVTIEYNITGLPPSTDLGFHVHFYGNINSTDGLAAKGHWFSNSTYSTHGCWPSPNRHNGDLGNISADANGIASGTMERDLLSLTGEASIVGRSIIVHASPDNCTGAVGFAGNRVAVGVIGISNQPVNEAVNPTGTTVLIATLLGANNVSGFAVLTQNNTMVRVYARIRGLNASASHGFHIHQFGDLTALSFTSAGGHWNPSNVVHGYPGDPVRHAGDMGNVTTAWNGEVYFDSLFDLIQLNGSLSVVGRAIVLHALADGGLAASNTTGNAGARLAAGVIGLTDIPFPTTETAPPSSSSHLAVSYITLILLALSLLVFFN